jgi:hypothetical protein
MCERRCPKVWRALPLRLRQSFSVKAHGERLRVFRPRKAEHHELAVVAIGEYGRGAADRDSAKLQTISLFLTPRTLSADNALRYRVAIQSAMLERRSVGRNGAFLTTNDLRSTFTAESLSPRIRNPYLADLNRLGAAPNLLRRHARKSFFDESGDHAGVEVTAREELLRQAITASGGKHSEGTLLPGTEGQPHHRLVGLRRRLNSQYTPYPAARTGRLAPAIGPGAA